MKRFSCTQLSATQRWRQTQLPGGCRGVTTANCAGGSGHRSSFTSSAYIFFLHIGDLSVCARPDDPNFEWLIHYILQKFVKLQVLQTSSKVLDLPRLKLVLFAGRRWDLTVFLKLLLSPGPEGVPGVPMCVGTHRKGSGMPSHPRVPG